MSIIINDGSESGRGRSRRPLFLVLAAVAVIALLVAAFLIGRSSRDTSRSPGFAPPLPAPVTWTLVGTQPVPESPQHGPTETSNGLATGFSNDELGAVFAAINISARLTGPAGPMVYETTARQQCIGDIEALLASIRSRSSSSPPGSTTPSEYFYRITSGDPNGDLVAISIAAATPQTAGMGGYAEFSRTLVWVDGDWKLQVPPAPTQVIGSVDSYTSLGRPDA